MVKANVPSAIKSNDLILSDSPHFKKLALSHSLIRLKKGLTIVRVSNVSLKPVKLSKHMSISHINTNDLGLVYNEP